MVYRQFGNTSLRVSEIGLGCSQLGGTSNSDKQILRTFLEAFDQGINFFDTADVYSQGRSEQLLGQAFRRNRANIILATKAGYHLTSAGQLGARFMPILRPALQLASRFRRNIQGTPKRQTFSPAYLRNAIEGSLRRLQTDYLDIFQLHSPASEVIAEGEFIEALESAKSQGKIRSFGVSCRTVDDARLCLRYSNLSAVQIPISLLQFEGVPSFLELSKQARIGVIARQPFASGLLMRAANSKSKASSVSEGRLTHHAELAKSFGFLAQNNDRTIAQAALEFVLRLPGVSLVIAGMNTREHLNENLAAPKRPLTSEETAKIYAVFDQTGKTRPTNI